MDPIEVSLAVLGRGQRARIVRPPSSEGLGQRLHELGFVADAELEVLALAPFGGDPLLVRIHGTRVALRRKDAESIQVALHGP
jgi:ferrous iron transport protein A